MLELKAVRNFVLRSNRFGSAEQLMADLAVSTAVRESAELYLAMLLVMHALLQKHVCIRLADWAGEVLSDPANNGELRLPDYGSWIGELKKCAPVVAVLAAGMEEQVPDAMLIVDSCGGCYLQRQWSFEYSIRRALLDRAAVRRDLPDFPPGTLTGISKFFPTVEKHPAPDYQQLAVAAALQRKLLIVSGGPGTGKTTVAAAVLGCRLNLEPELKIALAAPTAKAAARLLESLRENLHNLRVPERVKVKLSELESSTLHRLLGVSGRSHEFKHNCSNQLDCDLLLIDECSMVPQDLMARALEALPEKADLILLGDRYQLSSVEAGSVMADLCDSAPGNVVDASLAEFFFKQTAWQLPAASPELFKNAPLTGAVIELQENHRFAEQSVKLGWIAGEIRRLPENDNAPELAGEIAALHSHEFAMYGSNPAEFSCFLQQELHKKRPCSGGNVSFDQLVTLASSQQEEDWLLAFELLNSFKLLAPSYKGPWGLERLNALTMQLLGFSELHAVGMPLLITSNDYRCGLFNGDIGLVIQDGESGGRRVVFQEHFPRKFKLDELPEHEPVLAMSVHKSQGSGFDDVVFVMPDRSGELLSREMVYTAMTRAKKRLICIGSKQILSEALSTPVCRISNLAGHLRNSDVPTPAGW